MVRLAEVGRTNREHRLAVRSEKRACKTRGIGPVERDLASKEPASVEGIGHVEGARTRTGSGAWVGGNQHVPNASCLAGSNPHTKLDLHPFPKAMKPRHDRRRFGVLTHVLFTGLVAKPPGGPGQREGTPSRKTTRVREAVERSSWSRENVLGSRHEAPEIGVDSNEARPAHHQARGGSAGTRAS
jgi:hypothetical protein